VIKWLGKSGPFVHALPAWVDQESKVLRKLPPLNAVRAFEAAARHVSFSKAAKELFVTHGAISKQVSLLETWLGVSLFKRNQSHLVLTEEGKTFMSSVTPALDRISVTAMQIMDQTQPLVIRVNAPPTFTMRWLIPRISAFQRRQEGLEVKLTTSTQAIDFDAQQYDLAIRGALQPFPHMQSVPFMTETIVPICHPDLLEGGALKTPKALEKPTLISYDTEPVSWQQWREGGGLQNSWSELSQHSTLQFEQMYFALQAAIEGLGVVLVPLFIVADDILAGRLCAPFGLTGSRQRMYYANFPNNLSAMSSIENFCECLLKEGKDTEASIEQLSISMGWKKTA